MLDALRFVSGAVSKLDTVPALTHYRVEAGFVMGFNGTVALCSPINLHLSATPNAEQFYRALKSCDDAIAITQSGNTLRVVSGDFSTTVDCLDAPYPAIAPDGPAYAVKPGLGALLKRLLPIVGNDPARMWQNGALFAGGAITATNGVVIACAMTGDYMPSAANVPAAALKELVRTGADPIAIQWGEQSVTFHFDGGRWLRTTLFTDPWPLEKIRALLMPVDEANGVYVDQSLFAALRKLIPFGDDFARVVFKDGEVAIYDSERRARAAHRRVSKFEGNEYELPGRGEYNARELLKLEGLADNICWKDYPRAVGWTGDGVKGAIMGMLEK